jgi:MinD superfamily P-loop ATPase
MNEIVFISGKGGTGKTSLLASVIPFFLNPIIADCDVDAPDLHILLNPEEISREDFIGLNKAHIDESLCIDCGHCRGYCRFDAVIDNPEGNAPFIRECRCEGCGVCAHVCPVDAITMEPAVVGYSSRANTAYGPMIHARLMPGEEASGKLVYTVREQSRVLAREQKSDYILIDGSPGIGCSVISSLTNTRQAVIVTEPSMSAYHDLVRVSELVDSLSIPASVVINKCDISAEMTRKIEAFCKEEHIPVVMKLPFNRKMIDAISDRRIPSLALPDFFREHGFENFIAGLISESSLDLVSASS